MTEIQLRHQEIEATVLTEEEIAYAIWSAKAKKWSAERNKEHWQEQEVKTNHEPKKSIHGKSPKVNT